MIKQNFWGCLKRQPFFEGSSLFWHLNHKQLKMTRIFFFLPFPLLLSFFFLKSTVIDFSAIEAVQDCKIDSKTEPQVCIYTESNQRIIKSNGIPDHNTGKFPNRNNPNRISAQKYTFRIPLTPSKANVITPVHGAQPKGWRPPAAYMFGVAINGIPFDPGAGEFWTNPYTGFSNRSWQKEAMHAELGIDHHHAHVQPSGAYHYHGIPHGLVLKEKGDQHSSLIGYAADGFPVYYKYVYAEPTNDQSGIVEMISAYQLKKGKRPGNGTSAPNGLYDGTFVRDYEYVSTLSELDECNGRYGVTPEYPEGTYYYVITDDYPYIPRCFSGTPSDSFEKGPPNRSRNRPRRK